MKNGAKWILKAFSILAVSLVISASAAPGLSITAQAAADTTAPTKPTGLKAASVSQTAVTLVWQKSTDNVAVTSYAIFKNYAYCTYTKETSCTVTGLSAGKTYTFYVAGQDANGNISGKSNIIQVTTKTAPAATSKPASTTAPAASKAKIVAGYYASWAAYSGYTPSDIQAANLTHILYAFANIGSNYKIAVGDPEVDPANLKELAALKKKYPKLKTLISVGGWTWSGKFSDMASTASRRAAFADSAVAFIKKYGLDGVDLDWEYPVGGGMAGNSVRAADKANFTALLKTIREKLNAQGKKDGKHYLLSIAGGADSSYVSHVQMKTIAQYLDFATVMTYDMHGAYDSYTDLNAPLYKPSGNSPQTVWSCDQAVKAWTGAGFPKSKLLMGVPFYGHLYSGVSGGGTGIYKPFGGMKTVSYDQITAGYIGKSGYTRYYAAEGKTPWLFNGSTFITYEDPTSLASKAAYVNGHGLAGCGIWELSENTNGALLGTLRSKLK